MTRKHIPSDPRNAPLTTKELAGYELSSYDEEESIKGRLIVCDRCGLAGGTLVKIGDDKYAHADKELCKLMQLRKKLKA